MTLVNADDESGIEINGEPNPSGDLIGDPIEFLVTRLCPEVKELSVPSTKMSRRRSIEKRVTDLRNKLGKKSQEEIDKLFNVEKDRWHGELLNSGVVEESYYFMHSSYNADFSKWGNDIVSWSIEEASALLIGKNPDKFPLDLMMQFRHQSPLFMKVYEFQRLASRVSEQEKWRKHIPARKLVAWAAEQGFAFSQELVETVINRPTSLRNEGDDISDDSLSPREIGSLLTLVIAMAIAKYRYDPTKPHPRGATQMEADVKALQMQLTAETITKLLRKAKEKVDDEDVKAYFKPSGG